MGNLWVFVIKNVKCIMRCKPRLVFAAVLPVKYNTFGRLEEILCY